MGDGTGVGDGVGISVGDGVGIGVGEAAALLAVADGLAVVAVADAEAVGDAAPSGTDPPLPIVAPEPHPTIAETRKRAAIEPSGRTYTPYGYEQPPRFLCGSLCI
jgi:hypothetical protein